MVLFSLPINRDLAKEGEYMTQKNKELNFYSKVLSYSWVIIFKSL